MRIGNVVRAVFRLTITFAIVSLYNYNRCNFNTSLRNCAAQEKHVLQGKLMVRAGAIHPLYSP